MGKNKNVKVRVEGEMREWIDNYCLNHKGVKLSDVVRESLELFKKSKI